MQPTPPSSHTATAANDATVPGARLATHVARPLWRVLATSGYGLWTWLGLALALGQVEGRSGTLVPLTVGLVLIGIGLVLACLPGRGATRDWYGWQPRRDTRPTRAALLAFATCLPMLAVAGLARGDNEFWATRAVGAVLALCSAASLAYNNYSHRRRWLRPALSQPEPLPVRRLIFAAYAGGLWLWVCTLAQGLQGSPFTTAPWLGLLVGLALVLAVVESLGWRALGKRRPERTTPLRRHRGLVVVLGYGVPVLALLLGLRLSSPLPVAALAVPCCLLGRWLEQRQFAAVRRSDTAR